MKNLISMTDFLPEHPYSKFLKQPLALWMFVPCDERCLFEYHDLDVETINHHIKLGRTVEYFATFETLQLTKTALKQIGL